MENCIPVLVTTKHRGVFFGWIDPATKTATSLALKRCRNCIYWASNCGGFLGLAANGPNSDCKIGTEAPEVILHDVTSVSDVTNEAAEAWAAA